MFATIGDSGTHINLFDTTTLQNILKIFVPNITLKKLKFSNDGMELFVLTSDCKIKTFALQSTGEMSVKAYLYKELLSAHRDGIMDITFSNNYQYLISVGGDCLLKVWDYDFALEGPGSNQIFLGHINKINNVQFVSETRLITVGGFEGIYEWEFLGDNAKRERNINFESLKVGPQKAIAALSKSKVITKVPGEDAMVEPNIQALNAEEAEQERQRDDQQYQINYSYEDEEAKDVDQERILMVKATQQISQDKPSDGLLEKVQDEKPEMFKVTESEEDSEDARREPREKSAPAKPQPQATFSNKKQNLSASDQPQMMSHLSMQKESKFQARRIECDF